MRVSLLYPTLFSCRHFVRLSAPSSCVFCSCSLCLCVLWFHASSISTCLLALVDAFRFFFSVCCCFVLCTCTRMYAYTIMLHVTIPELYFSVLLFCSVIRKKYCDASVRKIVYVFRLFWLKDLTIPTPYLQVAPVRNVRILQKDT